MTNYLKKTTSNLWKLALVSLVLFTSSCATEPIEETEGIPVPVELAAKPTKEVTSIQKGEQYFIRNKHSGKFLDLKNYGYYDESNVHQWAFTGNDNQIWYIENFSGNARLRCKQNWRSLEVNSGSGSNGANIQVASTASVNKQKFTIYPKWSGSSQFFIKNINSGKVVDVARHSKSNGGNIHQWQAFTPNGDNNNQLWEFYKVSEYYN